MLGSKRQRGNGLYGLYGQTTSGTSNEGSGGSGDVSFDGTLATEIGSIVAFGDGTGTKIANDTTNLIANIPIQLSNGTQASPALQFKDDPSSGFYRFGPGVISLSNENFTTALFFPNKIDTSVPIFAPNFAARSNIGTQYSFLNDLNSGLSLSTANSLALRTGGITGEIDCFIGASNVLKITDGLLVIDGDLKVNVIQFSQGNYIDQPLPDVLCIRKSGGAILMCFDGVDNEVESSVPILAPRLDAITPGTPLLIGDVQANVVSIGALTTPTNVLGDLNANTTTVVGDLNANKMVFLNNTFLGGINNDTVCILRPGNPTYMMCWNAQLFQVEVPADMICTASIFVNAIDTYNSIEGVNVSGVRLLLGKVLAADGTQAQPALSFFNHQTSGMYAANTHLGITSFGSDAIRMNANTVFIEKNQIQNPSGNVVQPGIAFIADPTTGIARLANQTLSAVVLGAEKIRLNTTSIETFVPITAPIGTAAVPSYTFLNTYNTGLFSAGPSTVSCSTDSEERLRINNNATNLQNLRSFRNGNTLSPRTPLIQFQLNQPVDINTAVQPGENVFGYGVGNLVLPAGSTRVGDKIKLIMGGYVDQDSPAKTLSVLLVGIQNNIPTWNFSDAQLLFPSNESGVFRIEFDLSFQTIASIGGITEAKWNCLSGPKCQMTSPTLAGINIFQDIHFELRCVWDVIPVASVVNYCEFRY
jgi:hypothetical protein